MKKSIYITKQQLKAFCLSAIFSILAIMGMSKNASAGIVDKMLDKICTPWKDVVTDMWTTINGGLVNTVTEIFSSGFYDSIIADEGTYISNIILFLKVLGMGMSLMLFVYKLVTEINKQQDPVDALLKNFTAFLICFLCIYNVDKILSIIDGLGVFIVEGINKTVIETNSETLMTAEELCESFGKSTSNPLSWIIIIWTLMLPYIFSVISGVLAKVACYAIILELAIRRVFIPYAIADIGYEGVRSHGFRYLKKYLAVYFKEALTIMVVIVLATLQKYAVGDVTTIGPASFVGNLAALNLAGIILIFKASDWANDIVGA